MLRNIKSLLVLLFMERFQRKLERKYDKFTRIVTCKGFDDLFVGTPSRRKERGYPVIRNFASQLGLALIVTHPSRESWEQNIQSYLLG